MAAKAKVITENYMIKLGKAIKAHHALIQRTTDEMEEMKEDLIQQARSLFFSDLKCKVQAGKVKSIEEGVPEIYGNHEIPVDNNDKVTVNFQTGTKKFTKIDDMPANAVLKSMFGADYPSLFKETFSYEIISDEVTQDEEAQKVPELFGYSIRPDADTQALRALYASHPDIFERRVKDIEGYAKAFPDSVDTTTTVNLVSGFIEKLGKVSDNTKETAKPFIVSLFMGILKAVVKCGNASKK